MKQDTPNQPEPIHDRCFRFAVQIVNYSMLLKNEKQFEIANQIIKSGTSICANMREANNAYSKSDFIYKLNLVQKEADETIFWLELMQQVRKSNLEDELLMEVRQIFKIVKSISINTKRKL